MRRILPGRVVVAVTMAGCGFHVTRTPSCYYACREHATADATSVVDASVRLRAGDLAAVRGTAGDAEAVRRQFRQAAASYLQTGKSARPSG
jgi:hypothetical protein